MTEPRLTVLFRGAQWAPADPTWASATPERRARYWSVLAEAARRLLDLQISQGLDRKGKRLKPVRMVYRPKFPGTKIPVDGPPLTPHRALSRTRRLLRSRSGQAGAELYWANGWGRILQYHADGLVTKRGVIVRDVGGLSPKHAKRLKDEMSQYWKVGIEPLTLRESPALLPIDQVAVDLTIHKPLRRLVDLQARSDPRVEVRQIRPQTHVEMSLRADGRKPRLGGWQQVIYKKGQSPRGFRPVAKEILPPKPPVIKPVVPKPTKSKPVAIKPPPAPAPTAPPPPPVPTGPVPPGLIQQRIQQYLSETGESRIQQFERAIRVEADAVERLTWDHNAKVALLQSLKDNSSIFGPPTPARVAEVKAEIAELFRQLEEAQRALARVSVRALEIPDAGSQVNLTFKTKSKTIREKAENVAEKLSKMVKDVAINVDVETFPGGRGRAFARDETDSTSMIKLATKNNPMTVMHELGHTLDYQVWWKIAREFLEYRTQGETAESLRKKFGKQYREDEFGKSDKFQVVPGDNAHNWYTGKIYPGRATEITSMALEYLLRDPRQFVKDREYAGLIFGLLDGRLR